MKDRRQASAGAVAALVLVLVAALGWAVVVQSPLFDVRDVRVLGTARMSPEEVVRLLDVEPGANLLFLPLEEVASSVGTSPWFGDVTIERELPSTLVVRVRERSPVAWLGGREGGAVLAEDGTVLARRARPGALARVGTRPTAPRPGDTISGLRPELRVLGALRPRLRREVARVHRRGTEIVLWLRSGARVLYGRPEALAEKRAALESLMSWAAREGVEAMYLDVRAPGTPALRPAAPPAVPRSPEVEASGGAAG